MNFIHHISKAYPKKSCDKLINWFEENIDDATPGTAGEKNTELDDLEINITLKNSTLYWLPKELILFNNSKLDRKININLTNNSNLILSVIKN